MIGPFNFPVGELQGGTLAPYFFIFVIYWLGSANRTQLYKRLKKIMTLAINDGDDQNMALLIGLH